MTQHRTRDVQITEILGATAATVIRRDYPMDVYRIWVDRMLEEAEGRGYQRGAQNGREAGVTIGRHQAQSVISAAIAVALSEHGVDSALKGGDPLAFEPWPEMDALLVVLDAARPGWRDRALDGGRGDG
ncbi:hypothetical protein ACMAUO_12605 [Gluconacetobacter sp. Hr-1-5]|uniref:hypothetical protein n=1 Tax=Gluconacetobacter sp. Hr-1-5 TaxID=3395370 RepID=UPI003B52D648